MSPSPTVFVIGGGPGIGSAVARLFAKKGFNVGLIARNQSTLDTTTSHAEFNGQNTRISTETADVTDYKALEQALDTLQEDLGPPTVVVYNVASIQKNMLATDAMAPKPLNQLTPSDLEQHLKVCVVGALAAAQWAAKNLQEPPNGGKKAFFITGEGLSMYPRIPSLEGLAVGKAGLRNLSLALHDHYKSTGIHVASVTILDYVSEKDPKYNPSSIAEEYWKLYQETGEWSKEICY